MSKFIKKATAAAAASAILIASCGLVAHADYPIFYQRYTADPTVMVYDGRVYIYMTHDVWDPEYPSDYMMDDITCISSDDMKNWTDHGEVFAAPGGWSTLTWAPSVVEKDGTFYLYYANGGSNIGVATSDSPTGPFTEVLGRPLVDTNTPGVPQNNPNFWCFDPCAFIDDDGKAYLYFGGNGDGNSLVIELSEDMISTKGAASVINVPNFFEASYVHKYNGKYYFTYSRNFYAGAPSIDYAMSDSPTSGFEFKGSVLPNPPSNRGDNNHQSIFEFNGEWYIAYHNKALSDMNGNWNFERNVCIDKLEYNEDGTMKMVECTQDGLNQIKYVDPYTINEAETMAQEQGINTCAKVDDGRVVNMIDNGDWIKIRGVDFKDGAGTFTANIASDFKEGELELHIDDVNGTKIGTLPVSYTGGADVYREKLTNVTGVSGIHDLYMVFKGTVTEDLFKFDYWKFGKKGESRNLAGIRASINNPKIDKTDGNNTAKLSVTAIYEDGTSEDVASDVITATTEQNNIVSINGSTVTGMNYGEASITVSYEGKSDTVDVLVKDFDTEVTAKRLIIDPSSVSILAGSSASYNIAAEFADGHIEDITSEAVCDNPNPNVASVANGMIYAKSVGEISVIFSYKGQKGDTVTAPMLINVHNLNPYITNEAESYIEQSGIQVESCSEGGGSIGYIENGDWIMYRNVDFGTGAASFEARVSSETSGGNVEIRLDSIDGPIVGTLECPGTGSWLYWVTNSCEVQNASGVHDLYLKFTGGSGYLINMNWWKFTPSAKEPSDGIVPTITNKEIENNELKLSVSIANHTSADVTAQAILALYDGNNNLKEIKFRDFNADASNTASFDVSLSLSDNMDGYYVKLFVWDNLSSITSLSQAYTYLLN